ncbi:uncharacterized protein NEMAJ01_0001 [Nematocida major]|uniref:uncharacterized protein n=1 Tax=Nematocida major TaxID=1912982 RepID=UPI0020072FDC|nr:uncharacterized protein NEMAJ01_0001 [Nematocida major]KAH9385105.1 hypothetical protein NEMAJ01_0001 [Nematocida major]
MLWKVGAVLVCACFFAHAAVKWEYNSMEMRKNVSILCTADEFSKITLKVDNECPESVK